MKSLSSLLVLFGLVMAATLHAQGEADEAVLPIEAQVEQRSYALGVMLAFGAKRLDASPEQCQTDAVLRGYHQALAQPLDAAALNALQRALVPKVTQAEYRTGPNAAAVAEDYGRWMGAILERIAYPFEHGIDDERVRAGLEDVVLDRGITYPPEQLGRLMRQYWRPTRKD